MLTPERTIKVTLLDGSIVTMNTEERVIGWQSSEQMIPLTTDADSVFDDVLAALEETERQLSGKTEELAEAQQTIARQKEDYIRLVRVVKDASELLSWRDPGRGQGQQQALDLIYKWCYEHPNRIAEAGEGAES